ncbi:uncharacterized protein PAC_13277 [Phialocephala subalpina]|uniref:Uncharacterized protein n=1 Tax=Phialocephala subalpina TaxID=576137 RepID=A0A1L7XEA5_9HELO|nr:uncharacterized protein PAC_13277 [Phialocephala subalpina]
MSEDGDSSALSSLSSGQFQRSQSPEIEFQGSQASTPNQQSQKSNDQAKQSALAPSKPVDEHNAAFERLASNSGVTKNEKLLPSKEAIDLTADEPSILTKSSAEAETQHDPGDTQTNKPRLSRSHEPLNDDRSLNLDDLTPFPEPPKKKRRGPYNKKPRWEPPEKDWKSRAGTCKMSFNGRYDRPAVRLNPNIVLEDSVSPKLRCKRCGTAYESQARAAECRRAHPRRCKKKNKSDAPTVDQQKKEDQGYHRSHVKPQERPARRSRRKPRPKETNNTPLDRPVSYRYPLRLRTRIEPEHGQRVYTPTQIFLACGALLVLQITLTFATRFLN